MEIIADRLKQIPPYLFMQMRDKIRQFEKEGIDYISLAIGDPAEPTPPHIIESLRQAVLDPINHRYPTDEQKGMYDFRLAVAHWYRRKYGVAVNPDTEVLCLSGSKEGIHYLIMAVVNGGDFVLVTNPGYPGYRANILLAGAEPYDIPILAENHYLPDLDAIPEDVCRKARVFFLNYPNNPTGACASEAFFSRLVDWAEHHRILLVNDNPYSEFVFPGCQKLSLLQIPGAKGLGIEFNSLSKSFNMTGWRIGMVVGNPDIIGAMSKYKENVSSGVFNVIQLASIKALEEGDRDIDRMMAIYSRRRQMALEAFKRMGIPVEAGMGTFYLWVPVPEGRSSAAFATWLLEEAHVLVTAGTAYGQYGEGYFRISLTVSDDRLAEALERIDRCLNGLR